MRLKDFKFIILKYHIFIVLRNFVNSIVALLKDNNFICNQFKNCYFFMKWKGIIYSLLLFITSVIYANDTITIGDNGFIIDFFSPEMGYFCSPVQGEVISKYGYRSGRIHTGTDIRLNYGDTVRAAYDGIVKISGWHYDYGNLITLNHPQELTSYYGHLAKCFVHSGDTIQSGTPIGLGGRTGRASTTHLHFELRYRDKSFNPEYCIKFEEGDLINRYASLSDIFPVKQRKAIPNDLVDDFETIHKVKRGDTLCAIARKYGLTVGFLCELNNIAYNSTLNIGQILKLKN